MKSDVTSNAFTSLQNSLKPMKPMKQIIMITMAAAGLWLVSEAQAAGHYEKYAIPISQGGYLKPDGKIDTDLADAGRKAHEQLQSSGQQPAAKETPHQDPGVPVGLANAKADDKAEAKTFFSGAHLGMTIKECAAYYERIAEIANGGITTHRPVPPG
jgi:hypothetical protein